MIASINLGTFAMLDGLVAHRTPIGTAVFAIAAGVVFYCVPLRWFYVLPLAFIAGLVATVAWGILLGLFERPRYRL
jgi:ABC-type uncharacterized transport system permease subunit